MIATILCFLAALVFAVLFWVWVVRAIITKARKQPFGTKNIVTTIIFGVAGWIFFLGGLIVLGYHLVHTDVYGTAERLASTATAAVTKESVRAGWSQGLLKKLAPLDCTLEKVQEVEDEYDLTGANYRTFEATLVVENPHSAPIITYKELQQAHVAYAEDENGVFIPGMILNHSALDEIPWLFRIFAPSYRRNQRVDTLPGAKSYLHIRFDVADGHELKKIGFGEKIIEVRAEQILPLKKDDNYARLEAAEKAKGEYQ